MSNSFSPMKLLRQVVAICLSWLAKQTSSTDARENAVDSGQYTAVARSVYWQVIDHIIDMVREGMQESIQIAAARMNETIQVQVVTQVANRQIIGNAAQV
jgi:hypothetical protein